jgi:hypothetical protein
MVGKEALVATKHKHTMMTRRKSTARAFRFVNMRVLTSLPEMLFGMPQGD